MLITTKGVHSNPAHRLIVGDSIQHYVIKFVSDLRQEGGFLLVLCSPPLIKLITTYNWNIVENGIKHHNPNLQHRKDQFFIIIYHVYCDFKHVQFKVPHQILLLILMKAFFPLSILYIIFWGVKSSQYNVVSIKFYCCFFLNIFNILMYWNLWHFWNPLW